MKHVFLITILYLACQSLQGELSVLALIRGLNVRELKQITTTKATTTSPNKRFNEQNNSCARACTIES